MIHPISLLLLVSAPWLAHPVAIADDLRIQPPQDVGLWSRRGAAAAFDEQRGEMLTFGGVSSEGKTEPRLLAFSIERKAWRAIEPKGPQPEAISKPSLAIDARNDTLYVFGGWSRGAEAPSDELWALNLKEADSRWRRLKPAGESPRGRNGAVLVSDLARKRLILFGGDGGPHPENGFTPLDDLWAFELEPQAWRRLAPTGDKPTPRWNASGAVAGAGADAVLYVYGGGGYVNNRVIDDGNLYALDLAKDHWLRIEAERRRPPVLQGATLTWDDKARRLLLVGGLAHDPRGEPGLTKIWSIDPQRSSWTEHDAALGSTRHDHVAIYSKKTRAHIIVGGRTAVEAGNYYNKGTALTDYVVIRFGGE